MMVGGGVAATVHELSAPISNRVALPSIITVINPLFSVGLRHVSYVGYTIENVSTYS